MNLWLGIGHGNYVAAENSVHLVKKIVSVLNNREELIDFSCSEIFSYFIYLRFI
jgi:hypothetical protein